MNQTKMINDVKAVKNSVFIQEAGGDYVALHYDSEIFRASSDGENYEVKNLYVPSVTSSKMAKRCYEYVFGITLEPKAWKQLKERFNQ